MIHTINKFLDSYVGKGVNCKHIRRKYNTYSAESYELVSDNGTVIFWFNVKGSYIRIWRSDNLCDTISKFFGVDENESANYVKHWFGNKYGIETVQDVLRFIPQVA